MKKGRVVLVFWLVVLIAVLTSMASYAWLAMSTTARMRGFEVELESDSLYLEISEFSDGEYGNSVSFDRVLYYSDQSTHEIYLVSYGQIRPEGALLLYPRQLTANDGTYNGGDTRFYLRSDSVIGKGKENFIDVTDTLSHGQSLAGYYVISEGLETHKTAQLDNKFYYVKTARGDGNVDYSCLGTFDIGEPLAGRKYWGFSSSTSESKPEPNNIMNVVSMDTPEGDYCLKRTVFLRGAKGSLDLNNLRVASVEIEGRRNYLTDAIRVMFVATSDRGDVATAIYSPRVPFSGALFGDVLGDEREVVKVDIYVYFDGKDPDAHTASGLLTPQTVNVKFTIDDHNYN